MKKYRKAATSSDRVYTGFKDINGNKIKVGDVLISNDWKIHYCINYLPQRNIYYGIGEGDRIIHQEDFHKYVNYGVAIPKRVFQ